MNDEDKKLETIAEQWVNMVFAQIEAKKQKASVSEKENKEDKKGRYLQAK